MYVNFKLRHWLYVYVEGASKMRPVRLRPITARLGLG